MAVVASWGTWLVLNAGLLAAPGASEEGRAPVHTDDVIAVDIAVVEVGVGTVVVWFRYGCWC